MGLDRRGFLYGRGHGRFRVGDHRRVRADAAAAVRDRRRAGGDRASRAVIAGLAAAGEFDFGIDGISAFVTSVDEFYRIDTAIVVPQVSKDSWSLKIGGMVDQEIELTFDDLLAREQVERYVTLSCVSNPVGGDLVGNGVWQGVMLADVLREAGVQPGAEQLVSRSIDGWTCGTPVAAVMDGRDAMLAIGQNGQPLRAEHGYPVRMVVPGLYGYVSATKWVTEIELTTWDAFDAYWVPRGWAKEAPRQDDDAHRPSRAAAASPLPARSRSVAWPGRCTAGSRPCRFASTAASGSTPSWPGCRATTRGASGGTPGTPAPGEHIIEARAIDGAGAMQPEEEMSPAPNGAQGYHHDPRRRQLSTATRFVSPRSARVAGSGDTNTVVSRTRRARGPWRRGR